MKAGGSTKMPTGRGPRAVAALLLGGALLAAGLALPCCGEDECEPYVDGECAAGQVCDPNEWVCVDKCTDDSQCGGATPICSDNGFCRAAEQCKTTCGGSCCCAYVPDEKRPGTCKQLYCTGC